MYSLTLTSDERMAMDWIGSRYFHGTDLYTLLLECEHNEEIDWDSKEDIKFKIPEHKAWEIRERAEEEDLSFTCLAGDFKSKLLKFCYEIV